MIGRVYTTTLVQLDGNELVVAPGRPEAVHLSGVDMGLHGNSEASGYLGIIPAGEIKSLMHF